MHAVKINAWWIEKKKRAAGIKTVATPNPATVPQTLATIVTKGNAKNDSINFSFLLIILMPTWYHAGNNKRNHMSFKITKASGQKEKFDIKKFTLSLKKAGADEHIIQAIAQKLAKRADLRSTKDIYRFAMKELKKAQRPAAAKYNLKQALLQLGPTGYPFEYFVAEIFKSKGYETQTGKVISGFCVDHEVDLAAHKENKHALAECKFHNNQAFKTNVKVTLYVSARFNDIQKKLSKTKKHKSDIYECWVVTNTKFTTEAIKYARCTGIELLGWGYPEHDNIADIIAKYDLFPITVLTTLTAREKRQLIKKGFVLCHSVHQYTKQLEHLGLTDKQIDNVIAESEGVCAL